MTSYIGNDNDHFYEVNSSHRDDPMEIELRLGAITSDSSWLNGPFDWLHQALPMDVEVH